MNPEEQDEAQELHARAQQHTQGRYMTTEQENSRLVRVVIAKDAELAEVSRQCDELRRLVREGDVELDAKRALVNEKVRDIIEWEKAYEDMRKLSEQFSRTIQEQTKEIHRLREFASGAPWEG